MRASLYTVKRAGPGTLSTMAKPRGGDWLEDEMQALDAEGVTVLVSLLTPGEMAELDLEGEAVAAAAAGIEFVQLPTPDRGLPDRAELTRLLPTLVASLDAGEHVATHCRYAIGRSSLLAAAILVATGTKPDEAWRLLAEARGRPVPDTDEQRNYVASLAEWDGA